MSKVFFSVGMSWDGFIAGPNGVRQSLGRQTGRKFTNGCTGKLASLKPNNGGETAKQVRTMICLFNSLGTHRFSLDIVDAVAFEGVTHLHFKVNN